MSGATSSPQGQAAKITEEGDVRQPGQEATGRHVEGPEGEGPVVVANGEGFRGGAVVGKPEQR